jgi:hypothetical protein
MSDSKNSEIEGIKSDIEVDIERQKVDIETSTLREQCEECGLSQGLCTAINLLPLDIYKTIKARKEAVQEVRDLIDRETRKAFHQGYSKGIDDARAIENRSIEREKVKARLIELELLEQALNDGRDLQAYKLQRLEALEKESE